MITLRRDRLLPTILVAVLVIAAVVVGVVVWRHESKDDDPFAAYCSEVRRQRELIGLALADGPTTGLLKALPSFEVLAAKAPADVKQDWATVLDAIHGLQDALDEAGVDPATYRRGHPPQGVTAQERAAIDAAATRLASEPTVAAMGRVDQEARDVCHSPLSL